jgi:dihydroorotate dehydrogenase electron transfer subunit
VKYHLPQAPVRLQERIGENIYALTIACQEIAREAKPGQFVHIHCGNGLDPLLRRPISINNVQQQEGLVTFWYQVVGKGTELLSKVKTGETLDIIGPLGHGFETALKGKKIGLIGGGMGIAPLVFLGRELAKENQVQGFLGGRSKDFLPALTSIKDFPFAVTTDDGSVGEKGLVTALLVEWLQKKQLDLLYACGPRPMLAEVVRLVRSYKIPLQVSLESVMACGVGACLGCTCKGTGKAVSAPTEWNPQNNSSIRQPEEHWLKVCKDGPVFWAEEVAWDEE